MTSKLHINLSIGLIEVEGSEELVRDIYADFQKNLTSHTGLQLETDTPKGNTENKSGAAKSKSKAADKPKTTKKSGSSGEQLDVVSEFFNNSKPFLNEISKFEMPKGHQQRVLLFIYIMQKIGMKNITLNHIYMLSTTYHSNSYNTAPNTY